MRVHPLASVALLSLLSLASSAQAQQPMTAPPAPGTAPADTTAPPPSNLEAGGLRPPEAVDSQQPTEQAPGEAQVEQQLEEADTEDTGRGLEFVWLNGEVGYQVVGLQALSDGDLVDGTAIENNQSGLVFGAGLGVRLLTLTFGARFRYGSFDAWNMWSIDAEGAFHIPLGRLDLYFGLGAGYVRLGGFQTDAAAYLSDLAVSGIDVRAGAGLDYYLSSTFSIGVNVGGDIMFLRRSALEVPVPSGDGDPLAEVYGADGSSVGAAFTPMAVLGLHF